MRLLAHVSVFAVAAILMAWPVAGSDVETPTLRPLQNGDAGAYTVTYEGDWRFEGIPEGEPQPGPRFEVLPRDDVRDADGRLVEALPILWSSMGTTLLPDAWYPIEARLWFQDGTVLAREERDDEHSSVVYAGERDCLLSGPGACRLLGMRASMTTPSVEQAYEQLGALRTLHVTAQDGVTMEWWYASDIPVPIKFRLHALGPHQEPRTATYDLVGFREGAGDQMPRASVIVAHPLEKAPIQVWGLDDSGLDHPFRLSRAFDAALDEADLRDWLRRHPHGYVFQADYDERDDVRTWRLHLSDGDAGFSIEVQKSEDAWSLLRLGDGIEVRRIEASDLAPAAPAFHDVPDLPTITSVWQRWEAYVSAPERNRGANAWGFEILEDSVRIAGGRTETITWGPHGLALEEGLVSSAVTLDGDGRTLRFDRHEDGPLPAPASTPPVDVSGYAATGWPEPTRLAGIGVAGLGLLLLLRPCIALFSRLRPHELLDHPVRATIMDALRAEPGLHFRALCERLDANPGRIRHHLHKLEQGGILRTRQSPGYTCYFPADTSRTLIDAGPILRSSGARQILAAAARLPGASSKDLAGAAGLSPATTTYHVKRLQEAGLVDARRDGRSMRIHLTPGGSEAMDAFGV